MFYWIFEIFDTRGGFVSKLTNVLQYQTFRAVAALVIAFTLSVMFGDRVIRRLISLKMGQPIRTREEVNKLFELHGKKAGTPTMGGVLIIGTLVIAALLCCRWNNMFLWITLFVTLGLGALGYVDDYLKVSKKNSRGVSSRGKLAVQWAVGLGAGCVLYMLPGQENYFAHLQLPFIKKELFEVQNMGWLTVVFFAVVIVGCSNAVNLTDGLDGLASGCTVSTALAYGIFCYVTGNVKIAGYLNIEHNSLAGELVPVCFGLMGAALGFLWFNCYPARVFMGDTGSMAIGGCIASVAICCKQEVVLLIAGGVFVMEALSVMMQVSWFKITRRIYGAPRRLFQMTPIHHHFELKGWKESQVIVRFWILSLLCAMLGLATLKLR
ncbi:MAG: Phospho-N-acetylmuramoyl-pentapeptide-transferase [Verrucomicrobiales bacterium]|nr:Phospho-N-acetylmuramoyl-pentapeptide-transferase [Verrucomicrobiales bacterium]